MAARIALRQLAIDDADAAFGYLLAEASPGTVDNFVEALQQRFTT